MAKRYSNYNNIIIHETAWPDTDVYIVHLIVKCHQKQQQLDFNFFCLYVNSFLIMSHRHESHKFWQIL